MKWGVISCANIAVNSVIPAIFRASKAHKVVVSSRNVSKAKDIAELFNCEYHNSYDDIINDETVDVIYLPLPTALHFDWIVKAINRGKHILVEKSAVSSYKQSQKIIELAKKNNVAVVENFQFQHHSQHKYVLDLLNKGEIGKLRSFRAQFGFPPFSENSNIRYNKGLGGGALLDAGAYTLKASTFILGNEFEVKSSFLSFNEKYKVDWYGGAFLINKEKNIMSQVAFGFDNYYQCGYELWGSKGKITTTRAFTAKHDFKPSIIIEKDGDKKEIKLEEDDHFKNMINYFTDTIINGNYEKEWNNILIQSNLIDSVLKFSEK